MALLIPASAWPQDRILGLLEVPALHEYVNAGGLDKSSGTITLRAEPSQSASVVLQVEDRRQLESREHDYEQVSAVVYGRDYPRSGGLWYKLKVIGGGSRYGWVEHAAGMEFRTTYALVTSRMAHLSSDWDRRLRESPNLEAPSRILDLQDDPPSARVIDSFNPRGTNETWYLIAVIRGTCTGEPVEIVATGWVPAYATNGGTTMWYFSRGC